MIVLIRLFFQPFPPRLRPRGGLTLVEVLLGMLLLTLVCALAFSLVWGARGVVDRQSDWTARLEPASACLDVLVQDLACSLMPPDGAEPLFRLAIRDSGSELTCVTAAAPEDATPVVPLSRFRVLRVTWRIEAEASGGPALVRTAQPERASGETAVSRYRLPGAAAFEVRVYDPVKRDWVDAWETRRGGSLPAAARITLKMKTGRGAETLSVDTVIPAGMRFGPA